MKYGTVLGMALILTGGPVVAQGQGHGHGHGKGHDQVHGQAPRRAWLEQRYRALGEQIVRQRLNLSDDQMRKLRDVNAHYADRRRNLLRQQRDVQLSLRDELGRGKGVNQRHVAQLNGQLNSLMQQRFELQQQERGDLSRFLSPVQQAQYQGLQAQMRQKMRDLQEEAPPGELGPPPVSNLYH